MDRSRLSYKISICDCIASFDDSECLKVIRSFQQHSNCESLNDLLTKFVIKGDNIFPNNSLKNIENDVKSMHGNRDNKQNKQQCSVKTDKIETNKNEILFPLIRLPLDIIKKTTMYLNEKDIFNFEKCNRLFYQMINNLIYLQQTSNFKTFELYKERLASISNSKHSGVECCNCHSSWYKYSAADKMVLGTMCEMEVSELYDYTDELETIIKDMEEQWHRIKTFQLDSDYLDENHNNSCFHDRWLLNIFKSIKTITFSDDGMFLLDKLPIDILFDPNESRLECISFDHYWGEYVGFNDHLQEFECKVNSLLVKKKLKCVYHKIQQQQQHVKVSGPRYLDTENLFFGTWNNNLNVKFDYIKEFHKYHPSLKTLTFDNVFIDIHDKTKQWKFKENSNTSISDIEGTHVQSQIETLRLIDHYGHINIIDNCVCKKFVRAVNLHSSLKNLTIYVSCNIKSDFEKWWKDFAKTLNVIFQKKYFYNLENVNVLIKSDISCKLINKCFQLLEKNFKVLKYQFNSLNIGFCFYPGEHCNYYTVEWNSKIDQDELRKIQNNILQQTYDCDTFKQQKKRFSSLLNQWI